MRTQPLEPSVELPMGPRSAGLGGRNAGGEGEERRRRNAGRRLFKKRTQHHRIVGKKWDSLRSHKNL
eukprot:321392-Pyramimonas_sp.AAC.1